MYKPSKVQAEAHLNNSQRRVLFWGRQVGKTVWALNESWIKAVQKQGRYFIIFPTYQQAKGAVWNQYLHFVPKQLIADINSTDLTITLRHLTKSKLALPGVGWIDVEHDTDLPPSTIELKGSDEADRLRGMKAEGLIFDEYAIQKPEHWPTVFQPMLSTTNGWAAFVSSPKGFNHWYELVVDAERGRKGWWLSKATWRDNPSITPDFIKTIREEAEAKGDIDAFLQEYELEFRSVEGSVYPEFSRDIHIVPPSRVPEDGTYFGCIDFGWDIAHPTAYNQVLVDTEGNWWIHEELNRSKMQMSEIAEQIRIKASGKQLAGVIGDSARPDYIDLLRKEGMPAIPAAKRANSIQAGISIIGSLLKPRIQLAGLPKPKLFITSNCKNTIYEFEVYKYPSKRGDRATSEVPLKKDDHHMDALRYLALHLKYGVVKQDKMKDIAPAFNEYGIL